MSDSSVSAVQIARLFGIAIRLHISIVIIFGLIVASLGGGLFPAWQPTWTPVQCWLAGTVAGVAFFASLLIHEMSHALTARTRGVSIDSITLFLFGGVAQMRGEPRTPGDEFLIAAAGPAASFALAILFGLLTAVAAGDHANILADSAAGPEAIDLTGFGAVGTISLWLSMVNLMLAIFNLLPGFPMDGGRLLRAFLWWRRNDLLSATRDAARMGSVVGGAFVLLGVLQLMNGQAVNGLWLMLIGWFIHRLAQTSAASAVMERALAGFNIASIMRTRFERVPSDVPLTVFRDEFVLRSAQQIWPVTDGTADVGFISLEDVQQATVNQSVDRLKVADIMRPLDGAASLSPDIPAKDALTVLAQSSQPMPVVAEQQILGIVHQGDILRWLALHPHQATAQGGQP